MAITNSCTAGREEPIKPINRQTRLEIAQRTDRQSLFQTQMTLDTQILYFGAGISFVSNNRVPTQNVNSYYRIIH